MREYTKLLDLLRNSPPEKKQKHSYLRLAIPIPNPFSLGSGRESLEILTEQELRKSELDMVSLLNRDREVAGLTPLVFSEAIAKVARAHSRDMATRRFFNHVSPEGQDFSVRLTKVGIRFDACAENIAEDSSVERAHKALMGSPGHRSNILGRFSLVGIGIVQDKDKVLLVTQNFVEDDAISKFLEV
jgi:uncharacterized protein YkwD